MTSSVCRCSSTIRRGGDVRFGTCCTIDDLHDARRVAARLGIPHYIVNFEREVRRARRLELRRGVCGGPDADPVRPLQRRPEVRDAGGARAGLGAELVATGHYARVEKDDRDRHATCSSAALDAAKDQSYFLFTLDAGTARARQLSRGLARQARRSRIMRASSAFPSPTSRTVTRSASCPTAIMRRSSRVGAAGRPVASSVTCRARPSGHIPGCTVSPSASARGSAFPRECRSTSSESTPGGRQ